ncbi:MAG: sugar-binding domain-containing protein, partial [Candidatus Limnocylindrales bacterium]
MTARPWTTPELTGTGRVPMHSVPHPDRLELDGTWRFQLLPDPEAPPGATWSTAEVPGCWTMQGFADLPHYTNVQMPFAGLPPDVPAANPTGVYERTATLPAAWAGRRIVLHVGAAESVLIAEVNGHQAGVSKDSHLAAEFDVTTLVTSGANTIRLTVVKWSDATYIEDQDQWWHGGLTRSVFLYATDEVHLADIRAIPGLTEDLTTGTLDLAVQIAWGQTGPAVGWRVEVRVEDDAAASPPRVVLAESAAVPGGEDLTEGPTTPAERTLLARRAAGGPLPTAAEESAWSAIHRRVVPPSAGQVAWQAAVPGVRRWTAETPELYRLVVTLRRPDGAVVEEARLRIGFRRVEIVGLDLLLNGRRVFLRGVNR